MTMNKFTIKLTTICLASLALAAMLSLSSARAQTLTARQILERAVAALGGRENLSKVQTRTASGKVETRGITGTYQLWAKAPDRLRTKLDLVIQQVERVYDGGTGWERRASVRELSQAETARLRQRSLFNPLLQYANAAAELEGERQLVGAEAYEVKLSPEGAPPLRLYFDTGSFLLLREDHPLEEGELKISYGDYRPVNGVL